MDILEKCIFNFIKETSKKEIDLKLSLNKFLKEVAKTLKIDQVFVSSIVADTKDYVVIAEWSRENKRAFVDLPLTITQENIRDIGMDYANLGYSRRHVMGTPDGDSVLHTGIYYKKHLKGAVIFGQFRDFEYGKTEIEAIRFLASFLARYVYGMEGFERAFDPNLIMKKEMVAFLRECTVSLENTFDIDRTLKALITSFRQKFDFSRVSITTFVDEENHFKFRYCSSSTDVENLEGQVFALKEQTYEEMRDRFNDRGYVVNAGEYEFSSKMISLNVAMLEGGLFYGAFNIEMVGDYVFTESICELALRFANLFSSYIARIDSQKYISQIKEFHDNFLDLIYNALPIGFVQISTDFDNPIIKKININALDSLEIDHNDADILLGQKSAFSFIFEDEIDKIIHNLEIISTEAVLNSHDFKLKIRSIKGKNRWITGSIIYTRNYFGEPVFQIYFVDVTKSVWERKLKENIRNMERYAMLTTIAKSYASIVLLNLRKKEYTIINSSFDLKDNVKNKGDYSFLKEISREYIIDDQKDIFDNMFDIDNLVKLYNEETDELKKEFCVCYEDGSQHWIEYTCVFLTGLYLKEKIVVCMTRVLDKERSERAEQKKLLEDALNAATRANKAKTDFLSNMSHDIRTPMNGIMGITDIALMNLNNEEKVKDALEKISVQSKHLLKLINDILDMSKIESGRMVLHSDTFNIKQIAFNSIDAILTQASQKNISIKANVDQVTDEMVIGDNLRVNQILINLLGNAVKFTHENGTVSLIVIQDKEKIKDLASYRFIVKDTGIGINPEDIEKIFEPFERGENPNAIKNEGSGLGLSITKHLVDIMGGKLKVRSEKNKGSEFEVLLVFKIAQGQYEEIEYLPEEMGKVQIPDLKGINILLAEDNELNIEIAKNLLESTGAMVDVALNGEESIEKFVNKPQDYYSIIFMDIQMPKLNGYKAARAIRQFEKDNGYTQIPIVAMTANAFDEDRIKSLENGMNYHISKPIDVKELMRVLQKYIKDVCVMK
ncbi:Signal transduction histidine kinase [Acetitomaculum ruminis DSM 5522]|uniref:Circadian input-output histidine kinase CikA n=1 Tax=Acetitomaculum ruminis DSM 5522 TaxID=1120918 RepID=A0A1I0VSY5_9FIRM|nr:ATP-binding protein [Acetitomaculum ruminis]SFA79117.1 Signal transduction histidine kinase [Acetitomaculum ruminis DSM 5522]